MSLSVYSRINRFDLICYDKYFNEKNDLNNNKKSKTIYTKFEVTNLKGNKTFGRTKFSFVAQPTPILPINTKKYQQFEYVEIDRQLHAYIQKAGSKRIIGGFDKILLIRNKNISDIFHSASRYDHSIHKLNSLNMIINAILELYCKVIATDENIKLKFGGQHEIIKELVDYLNKSIKLFSYILTKSTIDPKYNDSLYYNNDMFYIAEKMIMMVNCCKTVCRKLKMQPEASWFRLPIDSGYEIDLDIQMKNKAEQLFNLYKGDLLTYIKKTTENQKKISEYFLDKYQIIEYNNIQDLLLIIIERVKQIRSKYKNNLKYKICQDSIKLAEDTAIKLMNRSAALLSNLQAPV
jgi:hypothetical protein